MQFEFDVMKQGSLVKAFTIASSTSGAQSIDFNQDAITFGTGADTAIAAPDNDTVVADATADRAEDIASVPGTCFLLSSCQEDAGGEVGARHRNHRKLGAWHRKPGAWHRKPGAWG